MIAEELIVKIAADTKEAEEKLEAFGKKIKNIGDEASKAGTPFLVAGGAITGALAMTVKAAAESEEAESRLTAALKATGQYSEETKSKMLKLSTQMENLAGVSDEAVTQAQSFGLQLGLSADQVEKLTPKVMDLSAATGIDMETAMRAAAMAVDGNTGMLQRYGVHVEKGKDGTVEFNNVLDAFSGYAGSAEAKGNTLNGQIAKVKETFGDLAEKVGYVLMPIIKDFIDKYIKPLIERLQAIPVETLTKNIKILAGVGGILLLIGAVGKLIGILSSLGSLFTPTGLIIVGIGLFITLIIKIVQHWEEIKEAMTGFYEKFVKPWLDPLIGGLEKVIGLFEKVGNFFKNIWDKVKGAVSGAASNLGNVVSNVQFGGGFQSGGEFIVSKPTMFIAGEAGTERVTVTPKEKEQDNQIFYEMLKELRKFNNETAPLLGRQISLSVSGLGGKI
jgi:hypothetical protein